MSNPSPEPSAESLKEARDLYRRLTKRLMTARMIWPDGKVEAVKIMAEAIDAAKRSSRREALGQAAAVALAHANRWAAGQRPIRSDARMQACLGVESALRALMEAE